MVEDTGPQVLCGPALNKMKGNGYTWSSGNVTPITGKLPGKEAWFEARSMINFKSPDFKHLNIVPMCADDCM